MPSATPVTLRFDGSNMNTRCASGKQKISTYADPDAATRHTRHHSYGRATTDSTQSEDTSNVISAAVEACVCSARLDSRP
ncbi:hypothetical protein BN970_03637 [Mycolicibacterium conceptionense]|uniref:Uncharacterized protein n=1 Tax=Mycolicibacterium conceptionense TaxID=451644 RepID=A0A0U1DJA1_9MYCO|nr:hypothetical protein BN970_03637 [Mycolicibacterium conceptionense]